MRKFFLPIIILSLLTSCFPKKKEVTDPRLQLVFADSAYQLTGIAVSADGRMFTSYPNWSGTHKNSLVEFFPGNKVKPYPDSLMNSWVAGDSGTNKWVCVQAVNIDKAGTMWVVDPASPRQRGVYQNSQKLVRINLSTNEVERTYMLAGATDNQSYMNDVRVDAQQRYAYLTNSTEGGIVIVDLNTGAVRQVLQGNSSVISYKPYEFRINDRIVRRNGIMVKINSDGLALSPDGSYLYYKPLTDNRLYRVKTSDLHDTALSASQLGDKVDMLGHYAVTDGMVFDGQGNLYMGDIENHRIIKIDPDMKINTLVDDIRLLWPDSYQVANGYLYITCSQIEMQPSFNEGVNKRTTPYSIYRIKLDGK